jgi:hypothetical protein
MFKSLPLLSLTFSIAALGACAPETTSDSGDLAFEEATTGIGKADHLSIDFVEIQTNISIDRKTRGGRAIVTSADSFEAYFGTQAPDSVDFDHEWVAFYGLGTRNTGGFSATISGISNLPYWGGMVLETQDNSPGSDCFVTQAITWPYTLVKFEAPEPTPTWFSVDHESEVTKCGPDNEDRLDELSLSLQSWESARDDANNSYTYTSEFQSFLGFGGRTTIVVDQGVVVERHYKAQHISGGDAIQWSEVGGDVGTHDEGAQALLVDDLYTICAQDILTNDEETHWINLFIDSSDGLLRSCTASHRLCNDDCSRGPNIASISF